MKYRNFKDLKLLETKAKTKKRYLQLDKVQMKVFKGIQVKYKKKQ